MGPQRSDLLVHDGRQLPEQVSVVRPHLLLVLQLVLLDQTLVDVQRLAARVRKAPAAPPRENGVSGVPVSTPRPRSRSEGSPT